MEKDYTIESLEIQPNFDIELFLNLCDTRRIEGDTLDTMTDYWERWMPKCHAKVVDTGAAQYLVAWLEEDVEKEVDSAWEDSPSDAFMVNALAQAMLMSTLRSIIPEIEGTGCAPVPKPILKLKQALMELDLNWVGEKQLSRRYAMLTHHPFKGGCEICYLSDDCPKMKGGVKTFEIGKTD